MVELMRQQKFTLEIANALAAHEPKHSTFSASGSPRWISCPGSISLEKDMKETSGEAALIGTAAHALAEHCLKNDEQPENNVGNVFEGIAVDVEMAESVAVYVDFCNAHRSAQFDVELRVDYSDYAPSGFGTADFVTFQDGVLSVIDLKFGVGVRVSAQKNPQLMLYALGALKKYDAGANFVDLIDMTIVQPRLDHIDTYTLRVDELLTWGKTVIIPAVAAVQADNPTFVPSKTACRWCRAKAVCRAHAKDSYNTTLNKFDDLTTEFEPTEPATLSDSEVSKLLGKMDGVIAWANAIKKHAYGLAMDGKKIENYKLVAGRGRREWIDLKQAEKKLTKLFGDQAFQSRLISPAQAEKLGKEKLPEVIKLWHKKTGNPTLAELSDSRPSVTLQDNVAFQKLDN